MALASFICLHSEATLKHNMCFFLKYFKMLIAGMKRVASPGLHLTFYYALKSFPAI